MTPKTWAQKDKFRSSFVTTEDVVVGINKIRDNSDISTGWARTIGYHRLFSESMEIGVEVSYMYYDRSDFVPFSISFGADLLSRQHKLKLKAKLGYTLASSDSQEGMDWGGSHLGAGLEYHLPVSKNGKFFLVFSTNYMLQERKYSSRIAGIKSGYRTHFFSSGIGMCFRL